MKCVQTCVNRDGSFERTCENGSQFISADNCVDGFCLTKRIDIDDCAYNKGRCDQPCTSSNVVMHWIDGGLDTLGVCVGGACPSGYMGNFPNCEDINECNTDNGGCVSGCLNWDGPFQCFCVNDPG